MAGEEAPSSSTISSSSSSSLSLGAEVPSNNAANDLSSSFLSSSSSSSSSSHFSFPQKQEESEEDTSESPSCELTCLSSSSTTTTCDSPDDLQHRPPSHLHLRHLRSSSQQREPQDSSHLDASSSSSSSSSLSSCSSYEQGVSVGSDLLSQGLPLYRSLSSSSSSCGTGPTEGSTPPPSRSLMCESLSLSTSLLLLSSQSSSASGGAVGRGASSSSSSPTEEETEAAEAAAGGGGSVVSSSERKKSRLLEISCCSSPPNCLSCDITSSSPAEVPRKEEESKIAEEEEANGSRSSSSLLAPAEGDRGHLMVLSRSPPTSLLDESSCSQATTTPVPLVVPLSSSSSSLHLPDIHHNMHAGVPGVSNSDDRFTGGFLQSVSSSLNSSLQEKAEKERDEKKILTHEEEETDKEVPLSLSSSSSSDEKNSSLESSISLVSPGGGTASFFLSPLTASWCLKVLQENPSSPDQQLAAFLSLGAGPSDPQPCLTAPLAREAEGEHPSSSLLSSSFSSSSSLLDRQDEDAKGCERSHDNEGSSRSFIIDEVKKTFFPERSPDVILPSNTPPRTTVGGVEGVERTSLNRGEEEVIGGVDVEKERCLRDEGFRIGERKNGGGEEGSFLAKEANEREEEEEKRRMDMMKGRRTDDESTKEFNDAACATPRSHHYQGRGCSLPSLAPPRSSLITGCTYTPSTVSVSPVSTCKQQRSKEMSSSSSSSSSLCFSQEQVSLHTQIDSKETEQTFPSDVVCCENLLNDQASSFSSHAQEVEKNRRSDEEDEEEADDDVDTSSSSSSSSSSLESLSLDGLHSSSCLDVPSSLSSTLPLSSSSSHLPQSSSPLCPLPTSLSRNDPVSSLAAGTFPTGGVGNCNTTPADQLFSKSASLSPLLSSSSSSSCVNLPSHLGQNNQVGGHTNTTPAPTTTTATDPLSSASSFFSSSSSSLPSSSFSSVQNLLALRAAAVERLLAALQQQQPQQIQQPSSFVTPESSPSVYTPQQNGNQGGGGSGGGLGGGLNLFQPGSDVFLSSSPSALCGLLPSSFASASLCFNPLFYSPSVLAAASTLLAAGGNVEAVLGGGGEQAGGGGEQGQQQIPWNEVGGGPSTTTTTTTSTTHPEHSAAGVGVPPCNNLSSFSCAPHHLSGGGGENSAMKDLLPFLTQGVHSPPHHHTEQRTEEGFSSCLHSRANPGLNLSASSSSSINTPPTTPVMSAPFSAFPSGGPISNFSTRTPGGEGKKNQVMHSLLGNVTSSSSSSPGGGEKDSRALEKEAGGSDGEMIRTGHPDRHSHGTIQTLTPTTTTDISSSSSSPPSTATTSRTTTSSMMMMTTATSLGGPPTALVNHSLAPTPSRSTSTNDDLPHSMTNTTPTSTPTTHHHSIRPQETLDTGGGGGEGGALKPSSLSSSFFLSPLASCSTTTTCSSRRKAAVVEGGREGSAPPPSACGDVDGHSVAAALQSHHAAASSSLSCLSSCSRSSTTASSTTSGSVGGGAGIPGGSEDFFLRAKQCEHVPGVCFDRWNQGWIATWREQRRPVHKHFSAKKYGFERARALAIEHRRMMIMKQQQQQPGTSCYNSRRATPFMIPSSSGGGGGTTGGCGKRMTSSFSTRHFDDRHHLLHLDSLLHSNTPTSATTTTTSASPHQDKTLTLAGQEDHSSSSHDHLHLLPSPFGGGGGIEKESCGGLHLRPDVATDKMQTRDSSCSSSLLFVSGVHATALEDHLSMIRGGGGEEGKNEEKRTGEVSMLDLSQDESKRPIKRQKKRNHSSSIRVDEGGEDGSSTPLERSRSGLNVLDNNIGGEDQEKNDVKTLTSSLLLGMNRHDVLSLLGGGEERGGTPQIGGSGCNTSSSASPLYSNGTHTPNSSRRRSRKQSQQGTVIETSLSNLSSSLPLMTQISHENVYEGRGRGGETDGTDSHRSVSSTCLGREETLEKDDRGTSIRTKHFMDEAGIGTGRRRRSTVKHHPQMIPMGRTEGGEVTGELNREGENTDMLPTASTMVQMMMVGLGGSHDHGCLTPLNSKTKGGGGVKAGAFSSSRGGVGLDPQQTGGGGGGGGGRTTAASIGGVKGGGGGVYGRSTGGDHSHHQTPWAELVARMPRTERVSFDFTNQSWIAQWKQQGCTTYRRFSVSKYGFHQAHQLAIQFKQENYKPLGSASHSSSHHSRSHSTTLCSSSSIPEGRGGGSGGGLMNAPSQSAVGSSYGGERSSIPPSPAAGGEATPLSSSPHTESSRYVGTHTTRSSKTMGSSSSKPSFSRVSETSLPHQTHTGGGEGVGSGEEGKGEREGEENEMWGGCSSSSFPGVMTASETRGGGRRLSSRNHLAIHHERSENGSNGVKTIKKTRRYGERRIGKNPSVKSSMKIIEGGGGGGNKRGRGRDSSSQQPESVCRIEEGEDRKKNPVGREADQPDQPSLYGAHGDVEIEGASLGFLSSENPKDEEDRRDCNAETRKNGISEEEEEEKNNMRALLSSCSSSFAGENRPDFAGGLLSQRTGREGEEENLLSSNLLLGFPSSSFNQVGVDASSSPSFSDLHNLLSSTTTTTSPLFSPPQAEVAVAALLPFLSSLPQTTASSLLATLSSHLHHLTAPPAAVTPPADLQALLAQFGIRQEEGEGDGENKEDEGERQGANEKGGRAGGEKGSSCLELEKDHLLSSLDHHGHEGLHPPSASIFCRDFTDETTESLSSSSSLSLNPRDYVTGDQDSSSVSNTVTPIALSTTSVVLTPPPTATTMASGGLAEGQLGESSVTGSHIDALERCMRGSVRGGAERRGGAIEEETKKSDGEGEKKQKTIGIEEEENRNEEGSGSGRSSSLLYVLGVGNTTEGCSSTEVSTGANSPVTLIATTGEGGGGETEAKRASEESLPPVSSSHHHEEEEEGEDRKGGGEEEEESRCHGVACNSSSMMMVVSPTHEEKEQERKRQNNEKKRRFSAISSNCQKASFFLRGLEGGGEQQQQSYEEEGHKKEDPSFSSSSSSLAGSKRPRTTSEDPEKEEADEPKSASSTPLVIPPNSTPSLASPSFLSTPTKRAGSTAKIEGVGAEEGEGDFSSLLHSLCHENKAALLQEVRSRLS